MFVWENVFFLILHKYLSIGVNVLLQALLVIFKGFESLKKVT